MSCNYSKHKDSNPEATVVKIQEIMNDAGLFPVLNWVNNDVEGAVSNRVTLYPTNVGTNGKGTDKRYAAASAFAELAERMQNNMLWLFPEYTFRNEIKSAGFNSFPDERLMSASEILDQDSKFFDTIFKNYGISERESQEFFIQRLYEKVNGTESDKIPVVPFVDPINEKIKWLPHRFLTFIFASNGMAAGNTMEEAMVQGLSEIFERWVNGMVIDGKVVPPEVPRDYLEKFSIFDLVKEFESSGRYKVSVRDCSLGRGVPVVASFITDKENGTLHIRFGSHPSFAIALERTLTETVQGGTRLENSTKSCNFGPKSQTSSFYNAPNIMIMGKGIYPYDLVLKKADWEFTAWKYSDKASNAELLRDMLGLLRREGFSILVRDVSFLGFPACFILVPGMSEIVHYENTAIENAKINFRSLNTFLELLNDFDKFPYLSEQSEKRLLSYIQFNEASVVAKDVFSAFSRPFRGKRMTSDRIGAFLALKLGKYELSKHFFKKLFYVEGDVKERLYLKAMISYVSGLINGLSSEESHKVLTELYTDEAANRVINETQDLSKIMERNFPHMNCFDCDNCELYDKECIHKFEREIYGKILRAMNKDNVSQDNLLKMLRRLMPEK